MPAPPPAPNNNLRDSSPVKQQQNSTTTSSHSNSTSKLDQADNKPILQEMFDEQINSRANSRDKQQNEQQKADTTKPIVSISSSNSLNIRAPAKSKNTSALSGPILPTKQPTKLPAKNANKNIAKSLNNLNVQAKAKPTQVVSDESNRLETQSTGSLSIRLSNSVLSDRNSPKKTDPEEQDSTKKKELQPQQIKATNVNVNKPIKQDNSTKGTSKEPLKPAPNSNTNNNNSNKKKKLDSKDDDPMTRNNQSSFARNPTGTYSDQHNSPDKFKPPPPPQPSNKEPIKENAKVGKSVDNLNKTTKSSEKGPSGAKPTGNKPSQANEKIELEIFDPKKGNSPRKENPAGYWDPRVNPYLGGGYPYGFLPYLPGHPFLNNNNINQPPFPPQMSKNANVNPHEWWAHMNLWMKPYIYEHQKGVTSTAELPFYFGVNESSYVHKWKTTEEKEEIAKGKTGAKTDRQEKKKTEKPSVRASNPELPSIAKKTVPNAKNSKVADSSLTIESVENFELNTKSNNTKKNQPSPAKSQTPPAGKPGLKPAAAKLEPIESVDTTLSKKNITQQPAMPSTKFGTSNSLKQQTGTQSNRMPASIKT